MSLKVQLFFNFPADRRLSMDIYGHGLAKALRKFSGNNIQVEEILPKELAGFEGQWGMRFDRYLYYPNHLPKNSGDICHILDQGYGHLLHSLKCKRNIVTVHDLIPLLRWKRKIPGVKAGRFPILNYFSFYSLLKADHLIAVSENTKNDLIRMLNCDPSRISVVYSGIDPIFHPNFNSKEKKSLQQSLKISYTKKKILISGSQFYKNNETALRVLSHLRELFPNDIELIILSNPSDEWDRLVRKYHLENEVRQFTALPRDILPGLYKSVDLLFFPSLYEGFGWPPLEAMACGTPVVASSAGSIPEVLGDAVPHYDPYDIKGFVDEISRILHDRDYTKLLVKKGINQSAKYKWDETAAKTVSVYERILS